MTLGWLSKRVYVVVNLLNQGGERFARNVIPVILKNKIGAWWCCVMVFVELSFHYSFGSFNFFECSTTRNGCIFKIEFYLFS